MGDPLKILINPRAGAGSDPKAIEDAFREAGLVPDVEAVEPEKLAKRLRQLRGSGRVAVAGGDGTQQTAATVLRGSRTVLIPIPAGHLNHFARRLGLETNERAAAAAAAGDERDAPLGVVESGGEHIFLNTAVIGAYPALIRLRQRIRPYMGIWPAATVAGLWVWARWPRFDLVIRTAHRELHRRTAMVWIGTGPGSFPAPHTAPLPAAGEGLEIVILPSARRRHALRLVRSLAARRRGEGPETVGLEVLRARSIEIDAHHHVPLTLDAEPHYLTPPVRIRLEDGALRVVSAAVSS